MDIANCGLQAVSLLQLKTQNNIPGQVWWKTIHQIGLAPTVQTRWFFRKPITWVLSKYTIYMHNRYTIYTIYFTVFIPTDHLKNKMVSYLAFSPLLPIIFLCASSLFYWIGKGKNKALFFLLKGRIKMLQINICFSCCGVSVYTFLFLWQTPPPFKMWGNVQELWESTAGEYTTWKGSGRHRKGQRGL